MDAPQGPYRLWGGRFDAEPEEVVERLNNSFGFDGRLWREDIHASIAHAEMLGEVGVLSPDETQAIVEGLKRIEAGIDDGSLHLDPRSEDVHTAVEALLRELIGPVAGKLHTARSRNDQVVTDLRLHLKRQGEAIGGQVRRLQAALLEISEEHPETIVPGFTHLQHAQPVTLAHHMLAYFWMLQRDRKRLTDCLERTDVLGLGAGALAGTTFPVRPDLVARKLDFAGVAENSMDAVSDRDFVLEFLSFASILMVHLSRLSEELVLWSCPEFGFVTLADSVTTGSSIMPQKKNPDVPELVRGKAGRVFGHLLGLLTVMKGLPLAYNKDLQEDKEALFDVLDTVTAVLPALELTLRTATFHADRMRAAAQGDFSTATDLADTLVRAGKPFREAHAIVGRLVRACLERGLTLEELDRDAMVSLVPELAEVETTALSPEASVQRHDSPGGPGLRSVRAQLERARAILASEP